MPTLTILPQNIQIDVTPGANLRQTLLAAGYSPYATLTQNFNCGGRGLCATCGVWVEQGETAPAHWHDAAASRFGYPRLSCQVNIHTDMTIRFVAGKIIWGGREAKRARRWQTLQRKKHNNDER